MQLSLNWLSEFVDLSDLSLSDLAHRITMSGLEVSNCLDLKQAYQNVIVGKIIDIAPHPNADKLQLTKVTVPEHTLSIVCGAKNIQVNDMVPVAMIGACLPGDFNIKKTKIRGQDSQGMLCSEKELAIAEDAAGIMHFPADTPIGQEVATLIGKDDVIIEVEVTPNRSDCLSHYGMARHLAAVLDKPLKVPEVQLSKAPPTTAKPFQVEIEPGAGCRRYCCRLIDGVTVGPSPQWLKNRLANLGLRAVNNVVDATNYVLMGFGHPLHAFDRDQLHGSVIKARQASAGESLITIDGQHHNLSGQELIVADAKQPVALAGVMGGLETEVTNQTKSILLEAAWFDAQQVRRTSKLTNCSSESAYRFERGVDPNQGLLLSLNYCAQLIVDLAGGHLLPDVIDHYPEPVAPKSFAFQLAQAERLLGMSLSENEVTTALARQGYQFQPDGQSYQVTVPSYRHDVTVVQDLIEDIAQLIGFDNIPVKKPSWSLETPVQEPRQTYFNLCRHTARDYGYSEILTYSFIDPAFYDRLRLDRDHHWRQAVQLRNPLSETMSHMRTSLLPGLIDTLVYNQRRGQERIFLFESGRVFLPTTNQNLPQELVHLGLIAFGPSQPLYWKTGKKFPDTNFYDLKGVVDQLLSETRLTAKLVKTDHPFLHPHVNFSLERSPQQPIGWMGALHPEIQDHYKLKHMVLVAELDLEQCCQHWQPLPKVRLHSRFPTMTRDIALAVPDTVQAGDVVRKIKKAGTDLLIAVTPFDEYKGESIGADKKSLAFSLTFQHHERTLNEIEVNQIQQTIITQLERAFSAAQR